MMICWILSNTPPHQTMIFINHYLALNHSFQETNQEISLAEIRPRFHFWTTLAIKSRKQPNNNNTRQRFTSTNQSPKAKECRFWWRRRKPKSNHCCRARLSGPHIRVRWGQREFSIQLTFGMVPSGTPPLTTIIAWSPKCQTLAQSLIRRTLRQLIQSLRRPTISMTFCKGSSPMMSC